MPPKSTIVARLEGLAERLFGPEAAIVSDTNYQLVLLTSMITPFGLAMVGPMLDSMIEPLGTSPSNVGLLISFFTAPGIVLIPVIGGLADRFGRKTVLVPSILLFGLPGTAIAVTSSFEIALGLRLLQGIGIGGIIPVLIVAIGDMYGGSAESTAQGVRYTVSGLMAMVIPVVAGVLVVLSWRLPFLLTGVTVPVAVAVFLWFEEPTGSPNRRSGRGDPQRDEASYVTELLAFARQPHVATVLVGRSLLFALWIGFLTHVSIIVSELYGGTPVHAGVLVGIWTTVFAIAASQGGRATAVCSTRVYPLFGSIGCLGIGYTTVVLAPNVVLGGVGTVLAGAGIGLSIALFTSLLTQLPPPQLRGGMVSIGESLNRVVMTVIPVLMGLVVDLGMPHWGLGPAVQLAGLIVAGIGAVGGLSSLVLATWTSRRSVGVSPGLLDDPGSP